MPKFRHIASAPRDGRPIIVLTVSDLLFRATPRDRGGWQDNKTGHFAEDGAIVGWYPVPALPDGWEAVEP